MNWYKKILLAQIWETNRDDDFEDILMNFYELEYKYNALKNFPFNGSPQRYQNIFEKVEKTLYETMETLKKTLISIFSGWLSSHAITDPEEWSRQRVDPYGEGLMNSYTDGSQALEGIVVEYIRYKNGGQIQWGGRMPDTNSVFSEMLDQALQMSDKFTSIQNLEGTIQQIERERLKNDYSYYGDPERFGEDETGEPFQTEEQVEAYIENRVAETTVQDWAWNYGKEELLSLLESSGQMEEFLIELNQHLVFPLWYDYWSSMGIDETRALVEESYNQLIQADSFEQFHQTLEVAIQTCHQNGSILDYIEQYGKANTQLSADSIKEIMTELTTGKENAEWDQQLKEIGIKIPTSVKKHNLEMANI